MNITAPWFNKNQDEWLREVLQVHFDKDYGTPYWLRREKKLGLSVLEEIRRIADLKLLGPMVEEDLATLSLEEFLPGTFLEKKSQLIIGETGGTTGKIKTTAYSDDEFTYAFVDFLKYVFEKREFPCALNWLYLGPSGPHIMFRNAQHLARALGFLEPFSVDFDPRWIKKMEQGSSGFERYKDHVLTQAERILHVQEIGLLFTTPVMALMLGERLSPSKRQKIRGMHLGGMTLAPRDYRQVREVYPNAVIIPGYGNTLFGVALELSPSPDDSVNYYPPGPRLILKVIPKNGLPDGQRIAKEVAFGEKGQIMFHRLDKCFFIPNMVERDEAERVPPNREWEKRGFCLDGVKDPTPLSGSGYISEGGLY